MKSKFYTISNNNGHELSFTNVGASIVSWNVPLSNKSRVDIILGFSEPTDYLNNSHCLGAVIGRVANRISQGKFIIENKEYLVEQNEGKNTLHSGQSIFANRFWKLEKQYQDSLTFSLISNHLDGGFPGTLQIQVSYKITKDNSLIIKYSALTDHPKFINLTNHAYFNLDGRDSPTVLDHTLQVNASHYLPVNIDKLPTGVIQSVDGSVMDLRKGRVLNQIQFDKHHEFEHTQGFDHNYELSGDDKTVAAILISNTNGMMLECFTNQPGLQVYTANHLDNCKNNGRINFHKYQGICLEAQQFPDSINHSHFPSPIIYKEYNQTTVYKISCLI